MPEEMHSKHQVHCLQSQVKVDWAGRADRHISQSFVCSASMVCSYQVYAYRCCRLLRDPESRYRYGSMLLKKRTYKVAVAAKRELSHFWTSVFAKGPVFE